MYFRMHDNAQSCLSLLMADITGIYHHIQQGLVCNLLRNKILALIHKINCQDLGAILVDSWLSKLLGD